MAKVTVIIPNYNHAKYLRRRVDSVLQQTYQDFDLLLLDDCSTDNSREILSSYATDPRVRLLFNDANSGSTFKQWNKGVAHAAGEYVWLAESDDYAAPTLLERLAGQLEANPNVGIAYCQSTVIDENDNVLRRTNDDWDHLAGIGRWRTDFVSSGREECRRFFVHENIIPNASAAVFRRQLYLAVGGADESMRLCGDWKLWTSILLRSDLAHIAEPLNFYRTHRQNVRSATKYWLAVAELLEVFKTLRDAGVVDPETLANRRAWIADQLISAWLWKTLPDEQSRPRAMAMIRQIDPAHRRRVMQRVMHRSWRALWSGRFVKWIGHLLHPQPASAAPRQGRPGTHAR